MTKITTYYESPISFIPNAKSLHFNGINQYAQDTMASNLQFSFGSPFSYTAWIKQDSTGGIRNIIDNRPNDGIFSGYNFSTIGATGVIQVILMKDFSTNNYLVRRSSAFIMQDIWYHVAFTYDGSLNGNGITFYGNGLPIVMQSPNPNNLNGDAIYSKPLQFSSFDGNNTNHMDGNMDEVAAYDKELSAAEILSTYGGGVPPNLKSLGFGANLIAWWRMGDSDTIPTITDQVGINNLTTFNMVAGNIETDVS